MEGRISKILRRAQSQLYSGSLKTWIRKLGLNDILSGPFWSIVHILSDDTQKHTVCSHEVEFFIKDRAEFMRFRNLSGEQEIIEDLLQSLEPDDVFYDIGSNVGTYACFAATKLSPGRTIAFEPEPRNVARLQDNIELNDLEVEVIEIALSDTDGTVEFTLTGDKAGEGEHAISTEENTDSIKVKSARGDSIRKRRELPPPTVLKIDVEGAELAVLRGLEETIYEHVRLVYVEVHPEKINNFGDTKTEVRTFLDGAGFNIDQISQRGSEVFLRASK